MADNTLKEFLVSIGYKVDEPSQKKFMAGMTEAVTKANLLSDAIKGVAEAAGERIRAAAESLGALGRFADRAGASTVGLLAFEKALSRLGVATSDTQGAIESLGRFRITVPGVDKFLEDTFKIKAAGRTTEQILQDLGATLRDKPYLRGALEGSPYLRGSYALIDTISRQADRVAELTKEEMKNLLSAGIDETTVKNVRAVNETIDSIVSKLSALELGTESKIYLAFQKPLEDLKVWLDANEPAIDKLMSGVTSGFGVFVTAETARLEQLLKLAQPVIDFFKRHTTPEGKFDWDVGPGSPEQQRQTNRGMGLDVWGARVDPKTGLSPNGLPLAGLETPDQLRRAKPGIGAWFRDWWNRGGGPVPPDTHGDAPDLPAPDVTPKSGMWRIPGEAGNVAINNVPVSSSNPLPVAIARDDTQGGLFSGLIQWWSATMPGFLGGGAGGGAGGARGAGVGSIPVREDTSALTAKEGELARQAYDYWRGQGLSHEQALAVLGDERGENVLGSLKRGASGEYGQFQWSEERRQLILRNTGIDVATAGFMDQQRAARWEFENSPNARNRIWSRLKGARTSDEAMGPLVHDFEISGNQPSDIAIRTGYAHRYGRAITGPAPARPVFPEVPRATLLDHSAASAASAAADNAGAGDKTMTSNINNNITIASPDPHTAAAMVGLHLDRSGNQVANVLQGAFQ